MSAPADPEVLRRLAAAASAVRSLLALLPKSAERLAVDLVHISAKEAPNDVEGLQLGAAVLSRGSDRKPAAPVVSLVAGMGVPTARNAEGSAT